MDECSEGNGIASIFLLKKMLVYILENSIQKKKTFRRKSAQSPKIQKIQKIPTFTQRTSFKPSNFSSPPIPPNRQVHHISNPLRPARSSAASERSAFPPERRTSGRVSSGRRGSISAMEGDTKDGGKPPGGFPPHFGGDWSYERYGGVQWKMARKQKQLKKLVCKKKSWVVPDWGPLESIFKAH